MPKDVAVLIKELPRGQFCVYRNKPDFDLLRVKQTHSNIVLDEKNCNELEADGIAGNSKTPLAILTADCLPILLLGENGHAMIHAGWRGLQNQILNNDLIKKIKPTYAFIGPHIKAHNYEVQEDFKLNFPNPDVFKKLNDKIYFDLLAVAKTQLKKLFPEITIEDSGLCTFSDLNFHSYRRDKTTERNWNVYIPKRS
jgi:YfiH family protein